MECAEFITGIFTRISQVLETVLDGLTEKWYGIFGRDADAKDIGYGHRPEDLANFKVPDTKTLLDYHHAVLEKTKQYTNKLSPEELDRVIDDSRAPTVALRLTASINDNLQHAGQVAYLRGWLRSQG